MSNKTNAKKTTTKLTAAQTAKVKEAAAKLKAKEREAAAKVKALDKLVPRIHKALESQAKANFALGNLLAQAQDLHTSGKALDAWSLENFGLQRSQTLKLIKVWRSFGSDPRFSNVSMRVLDMLATADKDTTDKAAKLAEEDKLVTSSARALLEKPAPKPKAGKKTGAVTPTAPKAESGNTVTQPASDADARIAKLEAALEAARAEIASLKSAKPSAPKLPMLPQFKAESFSQRLGLSSRPKVSEVREAYRALAGVWTPETSPAAFAAIAAAKDALLKK